MNTFRRQLELVCSRGKSNVYLHLNHNSPNAEHNLVSTKLIGYKQVNRKLLVLSHGERLFSADFRDYIWVMRACAFLYPGSHSYRWY